MRATFRVLAYILAGLIVVQAAVMAWAITGLGAWVAGGGVLDADALESGETLFPEVAGFMLHGMNGTMTIPLVALAMLIVSLFTKVSAVKRWAALVFLLVGIQIALGTFARMQGIPLLGLLHGMNALLLFTSVLIAASRARTRPLAPSPRMAADAPARSTV